MKSGIRVAAFPKAFIESLSNGEMSLFDWIEQAGTLGADGLELYPLFFRSYEKPYLNRIRIASQNAGLDIPMMCSSPDFTHPDKNKRDQELEKMKQLITVMAYLGPESFRSCRVLSGQKHPGITREEGVRWTVEAIEQLIPYAAEQKVYLVMENHYKDGFWKYPEFAQAADIYLEIIGKIASPWFGVNYDPSNAIVAGDDPLVLLQHIKHRIYTMHASDRYVKEGYSLKDLEKHSDAGYSHALAHGVIGRGLNDYHAIFEQLQSVHFTGWISIEDGINGLEEMRESIAFIREMIAQHIRR